MNQLNEQRQRLVDCLFSKVLNDRFEITNGVISCGSVSPMLVSSLLSLNEVRGGIAILDILEHFEILKEAVFTIRIMKDIKPFFVPSYFVTKEIKTFVTEIKSPAKIPIKFKGFLRPLKQPR